MEAASKPALGQFAAMLQRVHDGGDAFGEEIGADHDRQGKHALRGPRQQDDAGADRQRCRDQRPPEARHLPAQNVTASPATPLIRNIQPRKIVKATLAINGRDHGSEPQNGEEDAFEQERLPMLAYRGAHFGLQLGDVLGRVMANLPEGGVASDAMLYRGSTNAVICSPARLGQCVGVGSIRRKREALTISFRTRRSRAKRLHGPEKSRKHP